MIPNPLTAHTSEFFPNSFQNQNAPANTLPQRNSVNFAQMLQHNITPQPNITQNSPGNVAWNTLNNQMNMMELFVQFMNFIQLTNMGTVNITQPMNSQQIQFNQTSNAANIEPLNTSNIQIPISPTPVASQNTQTQNLENLMDEDLDLSVFDQGNKTQYKVDVKRMSYIASALQKRKIFFSGRANSDAHRFLKYLDETSRFMGLSEDEMFCSLPSVLTHEALEWFRLEEKRLSNFANFRKAFLEHYRIPFYQERLLEEARLRTQALTEPIVSFITCIRIIFDKLEPPLPLSRQLDLTRRNLNPHFAMYIDRYQISSFEDLLEKGKLVENKL